MKTPNTPAVILPEDERVTPRGLFNYGGAFLQGADFLITRQEGIWWQAPVKTLLYQSIELHLKAVLRNAGIGVDDLVSVYRHNLPKMLGEARIHGLIVDNAARDLLDRAHATNDVMVSRYIRKDLGPYIQPVELHQAAEAIRKEVRRLLAF